MRRISFGCVGNVGKKDGSIVRDWGVSRRDQWGEDRDTATFHKELSAAVLKAARSYLPTPSDGLAVSSGGAKVSDTEQGTPVAQPVGQDAASVPARCNLKHTCFDTLRRRARLCQRHCARYRRPACAVCFK